MGEWPIWISDSFDDIMVKRETELWQSFPWGQKWMNIDQQWIEKRFQNGEKVYSTTMCLSPQKVHFSASDVHC
jgi:hypothetical protein